MRSIDYLSKYGKELNKLNHMLSSLAEIKADIDGISGGLPTDIMAQFKAKGVKSSIPEKQCLKRAIIIPKLENKVMRQIRVVKRTRRNIENLIEKITSDTYKNVLHDRYIKILSWSEIAERENMEDYILYEIHQEALAMVENYID